MRADEFFLLFNEIDETLILEAEGESAAAKRRFPSVEFITAVAACFVAVVAVFVIIGIRIKRNPEVVGPSCIPYVTVNGTEYFYDDYMSKTELPEGYIAIGSVTENDSFSGCKVGDIIYQKPGDTSEILVYTELFHKGIGYWYVRFTRLSENTESSSSTVSTSSTTSKADVSTEPVELPMFFKEPSPEDFVYDIENNVTYVKNQLLISAELGAPELELRQIFEELGAEIVGYIGLTNDYQIEFTEDKTLEELEAAADYLDSFSFVQGVTLNLVMEMNTDGID